MILIRYSGDIATKARQTRMQFTRRLVDNLRDAYHTGGIDAKVTGEWNRAYVRSDDPRAAEVAHHIFGVSSISVGERRTWSTMEDIVSHGVEIFGDLVAGKKFAVRARRIGKNDRIKFTSMDVQREMGAALFDRAAGVDLKHPEVTASVEITGKHVIYFPDRVLGPGGVPLGTQGRALALVSGGFDSAVAAWMMLRRGVALDYLFLNLGGAVHEEAALRVMKVVTDQWSYGYRPKFHAVDLRPFVETMQEKVGDRYLQVILKRVMLRAAEPIARRDKHIALVTGEAVGQVSSQTLHNVAVIERATEIPILRPLVGFNKEEIIDRAHRIGTFELSAGVPEFCALTPGQPATRAKIADVLAEEAKLDFEGIADAVNTADRYDIRSLDLEAVDRADLAVDTIPDGAVVLDLRPIHLFRQGHWPDALHLEYRMALEASRSLDPGKAYVLYCEIGFKSAFVADEMRQAGFNASHVRGGARTLLRGGGVRSQDKSG